MNYFHHLQDEFEYKAGNLIRRVRTPAGARRFGQPIGSVIVPDVPDVFGIPRMRNEPLDMGHVSMASAPSFTADDHEIPTDYEGTRKFRLGRRVFYSWQDSDDGTWLLTDSKDNVLHEGSTEDEALSGLKKYIPAPRPTKTRTPRNPASGKKTIVPFRPATEDDLARVKREHGVMVPPAYKGSAMVPDVPEGEHAEPVLKWVDSAGRMQSGYSKAHKDRAGQAKFQRIKELTKSIKTLDAYLEANWKSDPVAAVLLLVRRTGMRPSSADNATGAVVSYGATTIQARHVTINQGSVRLKFDGKKGVGQDHTYRDPLLVEMFTYYKGDKKNRQEIFDTTTDHHLNDLIKKITGGPFKTKDLRTFLATSYAKELVDARKRPAAPKTKTEYRKWRNEVGDKVSERLGNTRTMALNSYIDPAVFTEWERAISND